MLIDPYFLQRYIICLTLYPLLCALLKIDKKGLEIKCGGGQLETGRERVRILRIK